MEVDSEGDEAARECRVRLRVKVRVQRRQVSLYSFSLVVRWRPLWAVVDAASWQWYRVDIYAESRNFASLQKRHDDVGLSTHTRCAIGMPNCESLLTNLATLPMPDAVQEWTATNEQAGLASDLIPIVRQTPLCSESGLYSYQHGKSASTAMSSVSKTKRKVFPIQPTIT